MVTARAAREIECHHYADQPDGLSDKDEGGRTLACEAPLMVQKLRGIPYGSEALGDGFKDNGSCAY